MSNFKCPFLRTSTDIYFTKHKLNTKTNTQHIEHYMYKKEDFMIRICIDLHFWCLI